ncbi:terpene synthase family protein [Enhygromyxa salina]|uniref:Terpene synthase n=1 Tax=Enhygromyxa salina TaxID=215803 RepID=A0A2S9YUV6_9BACT|nr:hypothetical protein [Enhygromyxa salina]PRQ08895.1 Germacrene A synthase [Enhygromyxa salina]
MVDPHGLTIPDISLPFSACTPHPAAHEIDAGTVEWLLDFGLLQTAEQERYFRAIGVGRWFPSLLPHGDVERVLLGSQLTAWYTILDDHFAEKHGRQGDATSLLRQLVHCEDIARLPDARDDDDDDDAPLHRALRDLSVRLREIAAPEQALRLQWHSLQYYLGIAAETAYTAQGTLPGLADYQRIRRLNSCIPPFFVMSEIARGDRLPAGSLIRPDVQRLTALAVDLVAVTNDIIGLPRDLERGDTWTLCAVLAHHRGLSVEASLEHMVAQFHRDAEAFSELADRLMLSDPETMPRYIPILQDLVAGHLAWTKDSPRYKLSGWQYGT